MHVLFLLLVLVITDWHPGFRALMVLSHNRDTFGLEREDTDELTLVLKGTRDSTGSSIEFKTAIENVVSSSKLDRLRSQTFQLTIGTGRPDLAIRDFQLPVRDKEKFATDLRELKRELHELDNDSLLRYGAYAAQFAIEGAKRIDCGDYAPSLIDESWFAMPMQEVDFVPVSLLRSLGLQKEIKLRVNQLPQVQAVYKRLLKAQLIEEDSEFPGSRVPKDLADCEKLNQVVYDTVVGILDDQQRARFDEILLQQYLATNTHLALYQLERVGYEVDRKEKKYVERATDQQMCFDTIDTLRLYRQIPVVAELLRRHTDAKGREKIDGMLQKIYVPYGGSRIFEDMPFLEQARGDSETKKSNRRRDK